MLSRRYTGTREKACARWLCRNSKAFEEGYLNRARILATTPGAVDCDPELAPYFNVR